FAPAVYGGAAENYLGDFVLAHKIRDRGGDNASFELNSLGAEVFRKAKVRRQRTRAFFKPRLSRLHVDHVELRVQAMGRTRAASNELLRCRVGTDTDRHALAYTPILVNVLAL